MSSAAWCAVACGRSVTSPPVIAAAIGCCRSPAGQRDATDEVVEGEDAERDLPGPVGDDDEAGARSLHPLERLAHRRVERHRHRPACG